MADWIYVDCSNVFIEGKRVSAVKQGLIPDIYDATKNRIVDNEYRISFAKPYEFVVGHKTSTTARAMLFGSRPPQNDVIWEVAKRVRFEIFVEECLNNSFGYADIRSFGF